MAGNPLKVGEYGKAIRISTAGFDISANSELIMTFVQEPTGFTRNKAQGVTAPTVDVFVEELNTTFLANEYFEYVVKQTDTFTENQWQTAGRYIDTGTPPKDFCSDTVSFEVIPCLVVPP